mgnify:CR=1 FL=1
MTLRIALAAGLVGLVTSCNLQLPSPPAWGEGDPPELIRFTRICLGSGTGCLESGKGGTVRYYLEDILQTVEWVEWSPVGTGWGATDKLEKGHWYDTPFSPASLTLPEGENVIDNYVRPVGQTGPWVLHRATFQKSLNSLGEPVFDFTIRTATRQWVAEKDLPFQRVARPNGSHGFANKEPVIPLYPPHSYCLAPGAGWPLGVKPVETWDNPTLTPPALYTYFQPLRSYPRVLIYRNGNRVRWIQSFMEYVPTAIPPATEARYVIYATAWDERLPGGKRWWRIWTPGGPLRLDLSEDRPTCQNARIGYGWQKTSEGVYRSGDWQAELLEEGFTFPGYNPDDPGSPPRVLPPELDPWR